MIKKKKKKKEMDWNQYYNSLRYIRLVSQPEMDMTSANQAGPS